MNNIFLDFLDAYKRLDEICRQILSCDRGISGYIDAMSNDKQGYMIVAGWEKDYKQLKRLRWIRNQLVHETNSFQENLVSMEDIAWLKYFRSRIMERTDPFSLLYQSRNIRTETIMLKNHPQNNLQKEKPDYTGILAAGIMILLGIILLVIYCYINI